MNQRRSFFRKISYFAAIAILLLPLSQLSRPSSGGDQSQRSQGGILAEMRKEHKLSQANLGEIDPASETMKLATLGMRGIAANILWNRANYYKKTEDWTKLSATLEQITKLQPNFISVWQFQAWNLSYNVSVEFDDYHDRYYWVIRGINFLKDGVEYNEDHPKLMWDIGWFLGQKIGRSDEHVQFRRLFKQDDDFHGDRPRGEQRDNWLVSREWFLRAEDAVLHKGKSIGNKSQVTFFSDQAMSLINYAEALENDGIHGEKARLAWKRAGEEWHRFGQMSIVTSYGRRIHLNDLERKRQEAITYLAALEKITEDVRKKMQEERRAEITPEHELALSLRRHLRTEEQHRLALQAEELLKIDPKDVAERLREENPEKAREASRLARLVADAEEDAQLIERYREIVNFDYWRRRCEFEQTPAALAARELVYKGDLALAAADLIKAKEYYDRGFVEWKKVFDQFPEVINEGTTGEELVETVKKYRGILHELDSEIPQDFILRELIEKNDRMNELKPLFRPRPRNRRGVRQPAVPLRPDQPARGTTPQPAPAKPDSAEKPTPEAPAAAQPESKAPAATEKPESEKPDVTPQPEPENQPEPEQSDEPAPAEGAEAASEEADPASDTDE